MERLDGRRSKRTFEWLWVEAPLDRVVVCNAGYGMRHFGDGGCSPFIHNGKVGALRCCSGVQGESGRRAEANGGAERLRRWCGLVVEAADGTHGTSATLRGDSCPARRAHGGGVVGGAGLGGIVQTQTCGMDCTDVCGCVRELKDSVGDRRRCGVV